MKNLVKFCAFSLLLVPLIEEEAKGQVFQVDQEWNFPAGTLQFWGRWFHHPDKV